MCSSVFEHLKSLCVKFYAWPSWFYVVTVMWTSIKFEDCVTYQFVSAVLGTNFTQIRLKKFFSLTYSANCGYITCKPYFNNGWQSINKQVLPKVLCEECVATPHGRECTCLLRVLAVQCPLQTSPVTQPWVHYIHTMILHQSLDTSVPNCNLCHNTNPTYHTNPSTTAG